MSIMQWRPLPDMDKWFDDFWPASYQQGGFAPAMDIYQTESAVVAKTPLPGIDPTKVSISIENDVLTVEGSVEHKTEVDEKEYYRKEIRSGSFHRAVALPSAVDGDKAQAVFENGMLTITIPKEERAKPKSVKIEIKN